MLSSGGTTGSAPDDAGGMDAGGSFSKRDPAGGLAEEGNDQEKKDWNYNLTLPFCWKLYTLHFSELVLNWGFNFLRSINEGSLHSQ